MIVFLVRHGESVSDTRKRYDGDYDDQLTDCGREQARVVASKLAERKVQVVFSSARVRAVKTAEIISAALHCDMATSSDLNEQDIYGAYPELSSQWPEEEYRRLGELGPCSPDAPPGIETYQELTKRVSRFVRMVQRSSLDTVAIVTHGGPIRSIMRDIWGLGEVEEMTNGAIIEVEVTKHRTNVRALDGIRLGHRPLAA